MTTLFPNICLYANRVRWLGVLICIQSRIGEESGWHLGKPPVGCVRSGFVYFTYFPGSSEISQKCYCYLSIFHWTSIQRLLQSFFLRQRAKWSFVKETIVISRPVNASVVFVKVTHLLVGELFNYFFTALQREVRLNSSRHYSEMSSSARS